MGFPPSVFSTLVLSDSVSSPSLFFIRPYIYITPEGCFFDSSGGNFVDFFLRHI